MKTCTVEQIEAAIAKEESFKLGEKTTVVLLTLKNGFEIIGTSGCVDPANYNHDIGVGYARKRALDKVWELEGYLLQSSKAAMGDVIDAEKAFDIKSAITLFRDSGQLLAYVWQDSEGVISWRFNRELTYNEDLICELHDHPDFIKLCDIQDAIPLPPFPDELS